MSEEYDYKAIVEQLENSTDPYWHLALARVGYKPEKYVNSADWKIRHAVAKSGNCLEILKDDESEIVRELARKKFKNLQEQKARAKKERFKKALEELFDVLDGENIEIVMSIPKTHEFKIIYSEIVNRKFSEKECTMANFLKDLAKIGKELESDSNECKHSN